MKKMYFLIATTVIFATSNAYAAQLVTGRLIRVELRESGFHAVYLRMLDSPALENFPNEGCDLLDRGVINENSGSGRLLTETLNNTRISNLSGSHMKVRLLVNGCVTINGPNTLTAPKIVKVEVLPFE